MRTVKKQNTLYHGWKRISVYGNATERGYSHGASLSDNLAELMNIFPQILKKSLNMSLDDYVNLANKLARKQFDEMCKEWSQELEGMVAGALSKNVIVSIEFLFAWNMYLSIDSNPLPKPQHCSAFIATGDATRDGKIVMAHNTHCEYSLAQFQNILQYVFPDKGHPFVMQTGPGLLCSSTDWFLCGSGIIGCETTIGYTDYSPKYGKPYFCRIRECMQYANNLEDCVRIMREDNAGDYPCGWFFGDINTNEIMLLEVAKTVAEPRRTTSGVFYGSNLAQDRHIRETQTSMNSSISSQPSTELNVVARSNRLEWLLNKTYWGKIDSKNAKQIISDHYDVHNEVMKKGTRSICKHYELKNKEPFGAIDGKVVTSDMAKKLSFWARWGSSCGRIYKPSKTLKLKFPYIPSFKNEPWTIIRKQNIKN
jgi:hypothetical protein